MKKNWLMICALVVVAFVLGYVSPIGTVHAQGAVPNGTSFAMSITAAVPCATPTVGMLDFCSTAAGFQTANNGGAYSVIAAKGDPGVQGVPGVKGDKGDTGQTGPQGLPGNSGSLPPSFGCSGATLDSTGWHFTGCK